MATEIRFFRLVQDSQEYGSSGEHMVSRAFCDLTVDGKKHEGLHTNLKQAVGSTFEKGAIEVGWPAGYSKKGKLAYGKFADAARNYYIGLVGSTGSGIKLGPGAKNVRMQNNVFEVERKFTFESDEVGQAW